MRNLIALSLVLLFAFTLASCIVVVKKTPPGAGVAVLKAKGKWVVVKSWNGHKRVKNIKMWRHHHLKGPKPFRVIHPGMKVKVIKFEGRAALIELPNGKTGWIRAIFVK